MAGHGGDSRDHQVGQQGQVIPPHVSLQVRPSQQNGDILSDSSLISVAEGGQQRMVITDKKNTPLPKRIIMKCVIS